MYIGQYRKMIATVCFTAGILLVLTPSSLAGTCKLYDPPTPGIHCFHGDEIDRAVVSSKTIWLVEFYSSWCGHCQHFAPVMKEIGAEVEAWSSVFKLGVLECTGSKVNQKACDKYKVQAYPTLRVSVLLFFCCMQFGKDLAVWQFGVIKHYTVECLHSALMIVRSRVLVLPNLSSPVVCLCSCSVDVCVST